LNGKPAGGCFGHIYGLQLAAGVNSVEGEGRLLEISSTVDLP